MTEPQILIEGLPYRSSTFPVENLCDRLDTIDDNDKTPLDELLRKFKIEDADECNPGFWSLQLLRRILSRDRILDELRNYTDLENAETYVDYIRPENDLLPESKTQTYLKIFALLVLSERGMEIENFVKEGLSDQNLPVCRHQGSPKEKFNLCRKDTPNLRPLKCFEKWKPHGREWFETTQWQLLVPYFDLSPGYRAKHYPLDDKAILPWRKRDARSLLSSQSSQNEGGYASVSCVRIDPSSHGFSDVLKDVSRSL